MISEQNPCLEIAATIVGSERGKRELRTEEDNPEPGPLNNCVLFARGHVGEDHAFQGNNARLATSPVVIRQAPGHSVMGHS